MAGEVILSSLSLGGSVLLSKVGAHIHKVHQKRNMNYIAKLIGVCLHLATLAGNGHSPIIVRQINSAMTNKIGCPSYPPQLLLGHAKPKYHNNVDLL